MIPEDERGAVLRELVATPAGALVTCSSLSMLPTIALGERVRVRRIPLHALRVGDVVLHEREPGAYIMHRVALLSADKRWFFHVGDAPMAPGPRRAQTSAILGRVDRQRRRPSARVYLKLARQWALRYLR